MVQYYPPIYGDKDTFADYQYILNMSHIMKGTDFKLQIRVTDL